MIQPKTGKGLFVWVLFGILILTWGSSFILIKKGLVSFTPNQIGALRMVVAGIILFPFALTFFIRNRGQYPWLKLAVASLTGNLLPAILFPLAQTKLPSSLVGALNSLTPLFTLVLGVLIFNTRFVMQQAVGITLGLVGALVLILSQHTGNAQAPEGAFLYGILVINITLLYAFNVNFVKTNFGHLKTVELTSLVISLAAIPSVIYLLNTDFIYIVTQTPNGLKSALFVSVLGAMGTALALMLFYKLVQMSSAVFAASNTYFLPFIALLWGVLDGENIGMFQLVGLFVILIGVYIANRIPNSKQPQS